MMTSVSPSRRYIPVWLSMKMLLRILYPVFWSAPTRPVVHRAQDVLPENTSPSMTVSVAPTCSPSPVGSRTVSCAS